MAHTTRRVISVITHNEHGVLSRIAGLFAGRGYNIESMTVAPIPGSDYSHFTIETEGDERVLEQIVKQLHKLVPVLKVNEHTPENIVDKEMALVKFSMKEAIGDIEALSRGYNGSIVNSGENMFIVMVVDSPRRVRNFVKAVERYHPKEVALSGVVAIER